MQIYANGQFLSAEMPCIHPSDRGFRYGDGVFETVRLKGGKPYQWLFHLERLEAGLKALRITLNTDLLKPTCIELIRRNHAGDGLLRIAVSRGPGGRGYLPGRESEPTLVIETLTAPPRPAAPLTLWLSAYEKISPNALPVQVKLAQGLNSTLARLEAEAKGCDDALLLNAAGEICEMSGANIMWLARGKLFTPALACGVLNGSTRSALIRLSPWPVHEGAYTLDDLKDAEAVIACNVALGAVPIAVLAPQGFTWNSVALAQQLQDVLRIDMTHDTQSAA
jgi:branched-chain amino acid aminotransferase